MKIAAWLLLLLSPTPLFAKNRDPKDYPQHAKVVSFQRQPFLHQFGAVTRVCHIVVFELDGKSMTASCFHCDPLSPGETYPARLDQREMVLYVIHEKKAGVWGQDNYAITEMNGGNQ